MFILEYNNVDYYYYYFIFLLLLSLHHRMCLELIIINIISIIINISKAMMKHKRVNKISSENNTG